CLQLKTYPNSF
nr:immunoglobulin light chain junction region [Macaca mulatta]